MLAIAKGQGGVVMLFGGGGFPFRKTLRPTANLSNMSGDLDDSIDDSLICRMSQRFSAIPALKYR